MAYDTPQWNPEYNPGAGSEVPHDPSPIKQYSIHPTPSLQTFLVLTQALTAGAM